MDDNMIAFEIGEIEEEPCKAQQEKEAREKEIGELMAQKKELEQKIRLLQKQGRQEGVARIERDTKKDVWRLCVMTEYFPYGKKEKRERWNPIMETTSMVEMKKKITDMVTALRALGNTIKI